MIRAGRVRRYCLCYLPAVAPHTETIDVYVLFIKHFFNMKEIEVQLSPFGEYPQTRDDGTTVNQICDAEAFQHLLENFSGGEIPVDFDHADEEDGSTRAGAWVERLWVDDSMGA